MVLGLLTLAGIYLFNNPNRKRKPKASRRKAEAALERREPTLALSDVPSDTGDGSELPMGDLQGQRELPMGDLPPPLAAVPKPPKPPPRKPAGPPPEKIVTLFLMARDNHVIGGAELLQAALKTGMEFGDLNIFHRRQEGVEQPVFSMANAMKPGFFDKDAWNELETTGLALFLTLPGPVLALDAWDSMLASGRRMAEILGAELHDEDHTPFTRHKEARVREEMRAYDRNRARRALTGARLADRQTRTAREQAQQTFQRFPDGCGIAHASGCREAH